MDTPRTDSSRPSPAGGQTLRLPGSARAVTLHEQLYRYADDLHQAIERNDALEADNLQLRASTSRLLESREELDAILQTSLDIHLITDTDGLIRQWNPASTILATPQALDGSRLDDWVAPSHQPDFRALRANALGGIRCPQRGVELRLRCEDTALPPLLVIGRVLVVRRGGDQCHLHWILRDVTHLRETEFETQVASTVFSNAMEGVMITDVEGEILAVNAAFTKITGYEIGEAVGRKPKFLASGHQSPDFYEMFWQSLRSTGAWQGVLYNRRKDGETYLERLKVNAIRDTDGNVLSYIAVFSELDQSGGQGGPYLPHGLLNDSLTGLASRELFRDRLERMLALANRAEIPFSLFLIDIDGFTDFNHRHGHLAGDRLLREMAARLKGTLRVSDTVARLRADDFAVLTAGLKDAQVVADITAKLKAALQAPLELDGTSLSVTISIGVANNPAQGRDPDLLLAEAARALDESRDAGMATPSLPSPDPETRSQA